MGEGRSGSVYHFEWRLRASPLALWPYVSDTQRLNEAIGLPEWRFTDKAGEGTIARDGAMRYLGVPIRWDEKPYEWVEGKEMGVERLYANGPLRRLKSRVRLSPDGERGTHLQHSLEFERRGVIWEPIARLEVGVKARRGLDRVYRSIDAHLAGEQATAFPRRRADLRPGAAARLADAKARLTIADACDPEAVRRALDLVVEADDRALIRLRPIELARRWSVDAASVLRTFLKATRRGVFTLGWDLMCPGCRGAKVRVDELSRLAGEAHCTACDVRIDSRAERALELVFAPSPAIRSLHVKQQCIGGPGNTPHIVWQRRVGRGESAFLDASLTPGTYRLRGPGVKRPAFVKVTATPPRKRVGLRLEGDGLAPEEVETSAQQVDLEVWNSEGRERLIQLERVAWHDEAVTIGRVLALQEFTELFPGQTPPPSLAITAGRLAVLVVAFDIESSAKLLEADERALLVRELARLCAEAARAASSGVVALDAPLPEGTFAIASPDLGATISAASGLFAAAKQFADDRSFPALAWRAALDASTCVAAAHEGRAVIRGDAASAAVALVGQARAGEVVLDARLAEESLGAIAQTRLVATPFDASYAGAVRKLVRLAPAAPRASTRLVRAEERTSEDARPLAFEDLELGEVIGRGGTAAVFAAKHRRDGRLFALKVLAAVAGSARARFERELAALARLRGVPGIVSVHGYGTRESDLWMALDLVRGTSLADRLEAGPLPVAEAAALLARVGRALHAAHTRGVVHRDVKPANVVLDAKGEPWLIDFGIAHLIGQQVKSGSGFYSGTLRYLPPEAFSDAPVLDARSDVYALGITFYEAVTGRLPFDTSTDAELIVKIVSESSPILEVDLGAAAVARHALHKRPEERYRTAMDMALDLDLIAKAQTPLHAPSLEESGETTKRFRDLFFARALDAVKRRKR